MVETAMRIAFFTGVALICLPNVFVLLIKMDIIRVRLGGERLSVKELINTIQSDLRSPNKKNVNFVNRVLAAVTLWKLIVITSAGLCGLYSDLGIIWWWMFMAIGVIDLLGTFLLKRLLS